MTERVRKALHWLVLGFLCHGGWLCFCIGLAVMPRDRSGDRGRQVFYDSTEGVQWEQGRARVFERWTRLFPKITNDLQAFEECRIDGRLSWEVVSPPQAVARALPDRLIQEASWGEYRGYRRVLEWGWPMPVVSCVATFDGSRGWVLDGGLSGPYWNEGPGSFGANRVIGLDYDYAFPNGGVVPLRVQWGQLCVQAVITAFLVVTGQSALRGVRKWLRRRSGVCVACGHRPGPNGQCAECGVGRGTAHPS